MWSSVAVLMAFLAEAVRGQSTDPAARIRHRTPVDRRLALASLLGGIAVCLLLWALIA